MSVSYVGRVERTNSIASVLSCCWRRLFFVAETKKDEEVTSSSYSGGPEESTKSSEMGVSGTLCGFGLTDNFLKT